MDRLTKKIEDRVMFPLELVGVTLTPDNKTVCSLLRRLAAYEDTCLEPAEIEAIVGLASENCAKAADAIDRLLAEGKFGASNADHIRAMNNEELADFLCHFRSDDAGEYACAGCKAEPYCAPGHIGMIDWLQQPAEDGDERHD